MKELVDLLVKQLKVDRTQATGGAAILFKAAQQKLGTQEFSALLGGLPGLDDLLRQAPESGSVGRLFGGFASALGGGNAALLASIAAGFAKLGLNTDHAKGFVPVMLDYLRGRIGKAKAEKLEQTLRAGL